MPRYHRRRSSYRKKFRRPIRRRYYRRKAKRFNRATKVIVRSPQIIPDRYFVKLRYQCHNNISSIVIADYQYRGNSPFDPEVAIGGRQPAGFDQIMTLYNNFRCHGSKITVEFINGQTGQTPAVAIVPVNAAAIPAYTNIDQIQQDPYARSSIMTIAGGSRDKVMLKAYMTTKKFFGYKSISQETDFIGDVSNNPTIQWYWFVAGVNYSGTATNIEIRVTITYFTEFFNRIQLIDT